MVLTSLRKHWFLLGVVLVIVSANFNPSIGVKGGKLNLKRYKLMLMYNAIELYKKYCMLQVRYIQSIASNI